MGRAVIITENNLMEFLPLAGVGWIALIAALFGLTVRISRMLAWTFVAVGVAGPAALAIGWSVFGPGMCEEGVLKSGVSADAKYRYAITETSCGGAQATYTVQIGQHGGFGGRMRTVLTAHGLPKPQDLRQIAPHTFAIIVSQEGGVASRGPILVRMDPVSGRPDRTWTFHNGIERTG
jgi:hypothetical protein